MRLEEIIRGMSIMVVRGRTDINISAITSDSREVAGETMFVAVKGIVADGHEYIADAINRGAAAVVCEHEDDFFIGSESTAIVVRDSRDSLAFMANRFCGEPSYSLEVVGITGTNGKTTTSYLIRDILTAWGKKTGVIGTIRYIIGDRVTDAIFTTPEPIQYQELLSEMKREGCHHVITEVSSHALSQRRVDYTRFSRAVFTNLSRDHLDYHGSMEDYFRSKRRLFVELLDANGVAILNADDEYARKIRDVIHQRTILFGIESDADVMAKDIVLDFSGTSFTICCGGHEYTIKVKLLGVPNIYNMLAAFSTGLSFGVPAELMISAISGTEKIDGRFETIRTNEGVLFIIDYAHTPDALDKLLDTVHSLPHKKMITVFGCGGNRDRGKRPLMGKIASEKSDIVILTSDNPRYEEPEIILQGIEEGIRGEHMSIPDREEAIRVAAGLAGRGDVVIVAGKGHENYQEIQGIRYPMSDKELIMKAIGQSGAY